MRNGTLAAIGVVALFLTHEGRPGDAEYAFHVGVGAILGVLLLWRVVHRLARGMTAKPDQPFLLNLLSSLVLWGFLAAIVIVVVTGYLLLATSCDGTLATTATPTTVRVVCNNTLTIALNGASQAIRVPHSTSFDPLAIKKQLGLP